MGHMTVHEAIMAAAAAARFEALESGKDEPDREELYDCTTQRDMPYVYKWVTSSVGPAGARTARAAGASRAANLSHSISADRRAACFASLWSDARQVATDKSCRLTLLIS